MIKAYHRPDSLNDALALLSRSDPLTLPMGGGTVISRLRKPDFEVVDLQRLGLNTITQEGQLLVIGATATLQQLLDYADLPEALGASLGESLRHETASNLRQTSTVAGALVSCDGRSPFVTALLALDPRLVWSPEDSHQDQPLGDYLPLRQPLERGRLILSVRVPLNTRLRFMMAARTPMDRPIVCAAVATWPSGRTRVTLGGFGPAPILAMDGPEAVGAAIAAREAYRHAGDEWASAAYRMDVAGTLVGRLAAAQTTEQAANQAQG